ncbi:unnamed protein product [Owenia fusiformis]|uniref:Uncharacterized protein n=1 Tax=Owenia fusiformis TaxID=6347 RepID=A0A8J1U0V8_OWEFU|nr:unnamed protein product [Owenia fusiformis]
MGCSDIKASRIFYICWGIIEILLCGFILGWPSLSYVFKKEGYFNSGCKNRTISDTDNTTVSVSRACVSQDEELNLVFTVSVAIVGVLQLVNGILLDRWGTALCRAIGIFSFVAGAAIVVLSNPGVSLVLFPATVLMLYGGYLILLTTFQLGNLVTSARGTVICVISGAFTSPVLAFLVQVASDNGVSVNISFTFVGASFIIVIISTIFWMPRKIIPWPCPDDIQLFICNKQGQARSRSSKDDLYEVTLDTKDEKTVDCQSNESYIIKNGNTDVESRIYNTSIDGVNPAGTNIGNGNIPPGYINRAYTDDELNEAIYAKKSLSLSDNHKQVEDRAENQEKDINGEIKRPKINSNQHFATHRTENTQDEKIKSLNDDSVCLEENIETVNIEKVANNNEDHSVTYYFKTPLYIFHLIWFSTAHLRVLFFLGNFNAWITFISQGNAKAVTLYTSTFSIVVLTAVALSPLVGTLTDRKTTAPVGTELYRIEKLSKFVLVIFLHNAIGVLQSLLAAIPVLEIQFLTFAVFNFYRVFTYGPAFGFIANAFPGRHFGKLTGLLNAIAFICSLLQYPFFLLANGGAVRGANSPWAHTVLGVLTLLTCVHPIYLMYYCRKQTQLLAQSDNHVDDKQGHKDYHTF